MNQQEMGRLAAENVSAPLWFRVFLVAIAQANRVGHAEFGPGTLRTTLGASVPRSTGEVKPVTASALSNAIAEAKRRELLSDESCARCLVLPRTMVQKEGIGTGHCNYHFVRVRAPHPLSEGQKPTSS